MYIIDGYLIKEQRYHMRKNLFGCLIIFCFILGLGISPVHAQITSKTKKDTVLFNPFAHGPSEKLVRQLWSKDPEYIPYFKLNATIPQHMTGTADVNDDGVREIFARHSDPEYSFCDSNGYTCRLHIYMIKNNQMIEIGRFMAGPDVIITPEKTNGFHNILTQNAAGHLTAYIWNGSVYAPQ
jgi:hypothetical protein